MRFQMVDTTGEQALHMVSVDPLRTPTFTLFANPDFFFKTFGPAGRTRRQLPSDGRVVTEALDPSARPPSLRGERIGASLLGASYTQLNASLVRFGEDMLAGSATALASGSTADDSTYTAIEAKIADLTAIARVLRGAAWVVGPCAAFGVRA